MARMAKVEKKVVPKGGAQHKPAPNGGEARSIPDAQAKMPKDQKIAPITHTPCPPIKAKMPKTLKGGRQTEPFRR